MPGDKAADGKLMSHSACGSLLKSNEHWYLEQKCKAKTKSLAKVEEEPSFMNHASAKGNKTDPVGERIKRHCTSVDGAGLPVEQPYYISEVILCNIRTHLRFHNSVIQSVTTIKWNYSALFGLEFLCLITHTYIVKVKEIRWERGSQYE